jgi:hypothetical protein
MSTKLKLSNSQHAEWEALCTRCGRCCYEKIEYKNKIYLTGVPCEYLDLTTNLCRVYDQRSQLKNGCIAINQQIIELGVLPKGCAYLKQLPTKSAYNAPLPWENLPAKIRHSFKP